MIHTVALVSKLTKADQHFLSCFFSCKLLCFQLLLNFLKRSTYEIDNIQGKISKYSKQFIRIGYHFRECDVEIYITKSQTFFYAIFPVAFKHYKKKKKNKKEFLDFKTSDIFDCLEREIQNIHFYSLFSMLITYYVTFSCDNILK